jgi:hypothetical protein
VRAGSPLDNATTVPSARIAWLENPARHSHTPMPTASNITPTTIDSNPPRHRLTMRCPFGMRRYTPARVIVNSCGSERYQFT